jgi:guanylate kinase
MWIALSGKMGTGKDYIVNNIIKPFIENELNKKCIILSFGDMIKINLMTHNNIKLDELYNGNKSPYIRQLLQYEGTENGRNIHGDDIWIKYLYNWGLMHKSRGIDIIIIPDLRFKNEYLFLQSINALVIRINAPNRNELRLRKESNTEAEYNKIKNHLSEIDLDDIEFEHIIYNNYL